MKQLKIKQEFLDYIKSGVKDFEIRKDPDLNGEVELIVVDEKQLQECKDFFKTAHSNQEFEEHKINCCDNHIKEKLKVKLSIMPSRSTYKIINIIGWWTGVFQFDSVYETENIDKFKMYSAVNKFLSEYWKNGEELYWYDLKFLED